ncbi:MAG: hypothetical protein ACREJ0_00725 [Geminicoccaceae bacterium]
MSSYERTGPNALKLSDLGATKKYLNFLFGRMRQGTDNLDALES